MSTGGPVFAVHGDSRPDDAKMLACLDLGRSRTVYQDPTFGIRQLVDVATQALSPAINQPSTAVQVIDRLEDLLQRIGRVPAPTGPHVDTNRTVRLVEPTFTPSYLLDLAFQEISQLGHRPGTSPDAWLRRTTIWPPPHPLSGILQSRDCRSH